MNVLRIYLSLAAWLLTAICAAAQEPLDADSIASLFLEHYAKAPQEKAYVHTDRDYYAAGDTVWFRAYIVDAASNQLTDRSKFVYLELLDNSADTLIRRMKIKTDTAGVFANALPLSSRMKSGTYTLAAYTQWMMNFGEEMFFKKRLTVINPKDSINPSPKARTVSKIALDIMPEGGNLIAGHTQRVAFKAMGDDGLGVDVQVRLVNAAGDVIKETASRHLGMGYILVNADAGEELWLEAFTTDGVSCRTKLPEALEQGATLSVNQHKEEVLIQPFVTHGINLENMALVLYGAGNLIAIELSDASPIRMPSRDLKPGVVNIALIDRVSRRVLAERLVFIRDRGISDIDISVTVE